MEDRERFYGETFKDLTLLVESKKYDGGDDGGDDEGDDEGDDKVMMKVKVEEKSDDQRYLLNLYWLFALLL